MKISWLAFLVVTVGAMQAGAASPQAQPSFARARKVLQAEHPNTQWRHARRLDINCDGRADHVFTGQDAKHFYVGVVLGSASPKLKSSVVSFLRSGSSQDALCGAPQPLREEPLDADPEQDEIPEGYERSDRCNGLELIAGPCDSFHLFWNRKTQQLDWWRM
jgi:hypothetical protein